jgi:hypothetical protein
MVSINAKYSGAVSTALNSYRLNNRASFRQSNTSVSNDNQLFKMKLEKHLDDYKKGKGYLEPKVSSALQNRHNMNNSELNNFDPSSGRAYSSYYSGLKYSERSRFTAGVNDAAKLVKNVNKAIVDGAELEKNLEKLIEQAKNQNPVNAETSDATGQIVNTIV